MKPLLRKKLLAFLFAVCFLLALSAKATITGGYISLDASSLLYNAHGCYWSNMNVYNNQMPTGGSGQFVFYWEENQGSGWVIKSSSSGTSTSMGHVYVQQYGTTSMRRRAVNASNPADSAFSNEVIVASFVVNSGSIKFASGNDVEFVPINTTPPRILNDVSEYCENPPEFYDWWYNHSLSFWDYTNAQGAPNIIDDLDPSYQPPTSSVPDTMSYWRIPYDGSCGQYPDNPTNKLTIIFVQPITFNPGTISSNVIQGCANTPVLVTSTPTTAPPPYTAEWQNSSDSLYWYTIGYGDSISYTITPPKYFRRMVKSQGTTLSSNVVKVSSSAKGDTSIFGNNLWNVYSYIGKNTNLSSLVYNGFYTDTALSPNTADNWASNLSPSYAANYLGCPLDTNNFTINLRRKGFDTGMYQLQIITHNQEVVVKKDGATVLSTTCCFANLPNVNLGMMDANTKVQLSHITSTSNTPLKVLFIKIDTTTTTSFVDSLCHSFVVGSAVGNNFIPLADSSGRIIAEVNPKGVNMGTLTVSMKHSAPGAANIPVSNIGVVNMPRYFNFKSSSYAIAPFPNPVTVRLYYLNSEFDDYKIATNQPFLTIADLKVSHYDGINQDCESYNNSTAIDTLQLTGWGYAGANAFYIDVQTNRFSEFGVSGQLKVLPVKWLYANASRKNKTIEINWKVAEEQNSAGFEMLKSNDGISFKTIATIASKGNSSQPVAYTFTDENIAETTPYFYYRIKQTDKDRRFSLSNMMKVKATDHAIITLQPNPVTDFTTLTSSGIISSYSITDLSGKVIQSKTVAASNARINTGTLPEGIYVMKVSLANGSTEILKLVKQ